MFDLFFFVLEELGAAGGKAATTINSLSSLDMFDVRCSFFLLGTLGQGLSTTHFEEQCLAFQNSNSSYLLQITEQLKFSPSGRDFCPKWAEIPSRERKSFLAVDLVISY